MARPEARTSTFRLGLSLIEVLVVVAIVGVLLAIGFAAPRRDRIEVNQSAERIARDLQAIRMEAVRRNEFVGFISDPGANGYRVYVDMNRDGVFSPGVDSIVRESGGPRNLDRPLSGSGTLPERG